MQDQEVKPLVSIIVPVYNVELYIGECIASLTNQTYSNIEIILVDDGSKDKSGLICDDYAGKDERIKVIHIQNSGVSHARNTGIEAANGEWITFVDSDDTIDNETLTKSISYIKRHLNEIDVLQFGSTESQLEFNYSTKQEAINSHKLRKNACASLYRASIIKNNNIRFIEGLRLGEDQLFNYSVIHHSRFCQRISDNFYNYRRIETSSTFNPSTEALIRTLKEIADFPYIKEFGYYIGLLYVGHMLQFVRVTDGHEDRHFATLINKEVIKGPYPKDWGRIDRLIAIMSSLSPYLAIKSLRGILGIYKLLHR